MIYSKKVYTILSPVASTGEEPLEITTLVQSPAISVLGIGFSTGEVHLHNVQTDKPLFTLGGSTGDIISATSRGQKRVTSVSFCTDPAVGAGKSRVLTDSGGNMLVVGHHDGDITLWNLKKRRIASIMRNAHDGPFGGGVIAEWLVGQNVLITSGGDNSIKVFSNLYSNRACLCSQIFRNGFLIHHIPHFPVYYAPGLGTLNQ